MRFTLGNAGIIGAMAAAAWAGPPADECRDWRTAHPEWIFCDDFEGGAALVGEGRYFEYHDNGGGFAPWAGVGVDGSRGLRAVWKKGGVEAGNLKLAFGRNPSDYMDKGIAAGEDFREIHYRIFVKMQAGWEGSPFKLSRATVISRPDWSQAMIAHLWSDGAEHLLLDPVRCVDAAGRVKCSGYNDFGHMDWIGRLGGISPVFSADSSGRWMCVETRVRLNAPGRADGLHDFRINGRLEARREGLDFVRGYGDYGINAVFFENYWNSGSPKEQERYFDNIVVSRAPVGCGEGGQGVTSLGPGPRVAPSAGVLAPLLPEAAFSPDGRRLGAGMPGTEAGFAGKGGLRILLGGNGKARLDR